ncbi:alkaline phosphatase family protein [Gracilibacillus alcaliphilus]|uniref:alkaline phosphatase family protein n=1 Tax=Gracilibacillus alcaliphilus TaxID=1401441 RepID=UPI0019591968|nr:alkaline phosphatase family protein [Gracilibacillus alcaliphilus]MBM7676528.1 putative AlkP superfamily pyrophosphatase or phosphodiesterase [Gracilibacillus alcaliphilus]
MSNKLIVVVLDGLRYDVATETLGYMEHLAEKGQALRRAVLSELPSLSRPLYEVLLTGTPSYINGINTNGSIRLSDHKSLFHMTKEAGLTNATASYYWVSELYNRAPFHYLEDRIQLDTDKAIQNGMFYFEDTYPDSHLLIDGETLRQEVQPDFLYIHSMNIDDIGHKHGGRSGEYRDSVLRVDNILAELIPSWLQAGYQVVVTADHGMSEYGQHGGTTEEERKVPLYIISNKTRKGVQEVVLPQLPFASFMCELMQLNKAETMPKLPASWEELLMTGEEEKE